MATEITYDPNLNLNAGYLRDDSDTAHGGIVSPNEKTLLHLLFHLLYTFDGRELMRNNKVNAGSTTLTAAQEQTLRTAFQTFDVVDEQLVKAILDAHVAAELWVRANALGQPGEADRDLQEKVYLQKMAFITWTLWEDAKGHEFSMGW